MNFSQKSIAGGIEILAAHDFDAIPIVVATPGEGTIVKAGTPLTAAGASTTGSDAVGILLYDVDTAKNPNGSAVVRGIIDATKAQQYSGVSYNSGNLKSALPGVILRDNIKALAGNSKLSSLAIGSITLAPTFDAATYQYACTATNSSDTITVETDDSNATAVIKHGSTTVTSGQSATWVAATTNTVTVTVTAENGANVSVYTVEVTPS